MSNRITVSQICQIKNPSQITSKYNIQKVFFTDHFIYLIDKNDQRTLKKISFKQFQVIQSISLPEAIYKTQIISLTDIREIIAISVSKSSDLFYINSKRQCIRLISHMNQINQVINYRKSIATSSDDFTVRIWDVQNQNTLLQSKIKHIYSGHSGKVTCFQTYQNILASGSNDKSVIFWKNDQIWCSLKTNSAISNLLKCIQSDQFLVFTQNGQIFVLSIKSIVKNRKPQILRIIKYEAQNKVLARNRFKFCQQIDDSFFVFTDSNKIVFSQINLGEIIHQKKLAQQQNQKILEFKCIGRLILLGFYKGNLSLLSY